MDDNRTYPNIQNNDGDTALIIASYRGHIEIVKLLMDDNRTYPNIKNKNGDTPLIIASYFGRTAIVELLLNERSEEGSQEVPVRERDIDKRTDPNIQNNLGNTALILASSMYHTDVVELLMYHIRTNLNIQNNNGDTALICSIRGRTNRFRNRTLEVVKILLDGLPDKILLNTFSKPKPKTEVGFDEQGMEALKNAKKKRNEAVRGNGNHTRSFMSPSYSYPSLIVKNQRYVPNNKEMGGIQLTSKEKFILPNLPDDTLDINIQNKNGYTALMFAVKNIKLNELDKDIIELLVTKGANARLKNNDNKNSIELLHNSVRTYFDCLMEYAPLVYRQINYLLNESSIFYSTHNV